MCCSTTTARVASGSPIPPKRPVVRPRAPPPRDPSLEELESTVINLQQRLNRWRQRLGRIYRRHRNALLVAGGAFNLAYGGGFAFTLLFVQAFEHTGWPLMQGGLERAKNAYLTAKANAPTRETSDYADRVAPLRKELVELSAELAVHRRGGGSETAQKVRPPSCLALNTPTHARDPRPSAPGAGVPQAHAGAADRVGDHAGPAPRRARAGRGLRAGGAARRDAGALVGRHRLARLGLLLRRAHRRHRSAARRPGRQLRHRCAGQARANRAQMSLGAPGGGRHAALPGALARRHGRDAPRRPHPRLPRRLQAAVPRRRAHCLRHGGQGAGRAAPPSTQSHPAARRGPD